MLPQNQPSQSEKNASQTTSAVAHPIFLERTGFMSFFHELFLLRLSFTIKPIRPRRCTLSAPVVGRRLWRRKRSHKKLRLLNSALEDNDGRIISNEHKPCKMFCLYLPGCLHATPLYNTEQGKEPDQANAKRIPVGFRMRRQLNRGRQNSWITFLIKIW